MGEGIEHEYNPQSKTEKLEAELEALGQQRLSALSVLRDAGLYDLAFEDGGQVAEDVLVSRLIGHFSGTGVDKGELQTVDSRTETPIQKLEELKSEFEFTKESEALQKAFSQLADAAKLAEKFRRASDFLDKINRNGNEVTRWKAQKALSFIEKMLNNAGSQNAVRGLNWILNEIIVKVEQQQDFSHFDIEIPEISTHDGFNLPYLNDMKRTARTARQMRDPFLK